MLALLAMPSLANAAEVRLRDSLQVSTSADHAWTWLELSDTRPLADMPTNWVLHVDQVRFAHMAAIAIRRDGRQERFDLVGSDVGDNWAPGGVLSFRFRTPGREITALQLGFDRIDNPSLLRKVSALTPHEAHIVDERWVLLVGVLSGLLLSAFIYNVFVYAGQRYPFQRWYLAWVPAALAYTLSWTDVAAYVVPWIAGPNGVRVDDILVGVLIALGCNFLLSVLEAGMVPRRLRYAVRTLSACCVVSGVLAADEALMPAALSDRLLNLLLVASVMTSLVVIATAVARRSRVVWLYMIGWAPVIAVFACRMARNFGFVEQSDAIDMATFAAVGFESVVFSLLIADRFLSLRRERDAAEATTRGMEIERETLRRAAHADFLTGLGNRAYFHERMRELLEHGGPFQLFLLDVDYLKELNDRQGHDAGDAILQHIGMSLAAFENERTFCARIGGDEFAILVGGPETHAAALVAGLARLQGMMWTRYTWSGVLSLSIGCTSSDGATDQAEVFQRADIALYEAKKMGRGRLQRFDARLQEQVQSRRQMIGQAQAALGAAQFQLHFQPIVDVRASSLIGVEALLRWNHPTLGLITPGAFTAVLADPEIGAAVQNRVIDLAIAELRRRPHFTGRLAVNFTAMDLRGADAARALLDRLDAGEVSPRSLCVEVTEGIILGRGGTAPAEALHVLHDAGVHIALDDFGTGYASLVHLKEIPVDALKIDSSFVAGLLKPGDESEEIVRAVLALGHGLKKTVVAEGVENVGQLLRLRELGCDQAQGYLFGQPGPGFPSTVGVRAAA